MLAYAREARLPNPRSWCIEVGSERLIVHIVAETRRIQPLHVVLLSIHRDHDEEQDE